MHAADIFFQKKKKLSCCSLKAVNKALKLDLNSSLFIRRPGIQCNEYMFLDPFMAVLRHFIA